MPNLVTNTDPSVNRNGNRPEADQKVNGNLTVCGDVLPCADATYDIGSDLLRWALGYLDILYVAGAASGDGVTGGADVVVGDGAGSRGITIFSENNADGGLFCTDDGTDRGSFRYEHSFDIWTWRVNGALSMRLSSVNLRPYSDALIGLGASSIRWGTSYINTVVAKSGVQLGDTSSDGPTHYGGSGAPGAGLGSNGDFYFRSDGVAGATPCIYHKEAGSWVSLV